MESSASPAPWVQGFHGEPERGFLTGPNGQVAADYECSDCMDEGDAAFIAAFRNVASELIALWEAAENLWCYDNYQINGGEEYRASQAAFDKALDRLNTKATG